MTEMYVAPPFVWALAAAGAVYLGAVIYLWIYLKQAHADIWLELQGSSPFNAIFVSFRTIGFLVSRKHKSLFDAKLTAIVWSVRALFLLLVALVIVGKHFELIPPR